MSSSSAAFPLDHLPSPPSEQLCYVHCNFCDTVLAVSVPYTSLFKTVTVRCGHCTNLLSVNMRGLLLPAANQLHLSHSCLTPAHHSLLDELQCPPPSLPLDPSLLCNGSSNNNNNSSTVNTNSSSSTSSLVNSNISVVNSSTHINSNCSSLAPVKGMEEEVPRTPVVNRPPEKRQRVPSAYNRFIKDEIQRIKAGNPDITHREAFSAAAKNWAHFPHIHFGLMPDQGLKKASVRQPLQEGEADVLPKEGFYATAAAAAAAAAAANMGVAPF